MKPSGDETEGRVVEVEHNEASYPVATISGSNRSLIGRVFCLQGREPGFPEILQTADKLEKLNIFEHRNHPS